MKFLYFSIVFLFVGLLSCGEESRKIDEVNSRPLTFEETVRAHTEHYCKCAKPLHDFSNSIDAETMDSAQYVQYKYKQAEFMQCFDPQGRLKAFRDTLSPEMKKKQLELFDKYRQEICPEIIPNR